MRIRTKRHELIITPGECWSAQGEPIDVDQQMNDICLSCCRTQDSERTAS